MIKFALSCQSNHQFEGWFASSDEFETQRQRAIVACPICGSCDVEKALMAPSLTTSKNRDIVKVAAGGQARKKILAKMKKLRDQITTNAENVGESFPEEARKIHYGEAEERGIYGEASLDEAKKLVDEGVQIAPLPVLPEDAN